MHVLSVLAVEGDDETEAVSAAKIFLTGYLDQVFDYFVPGGRWEHLHPGSPAVCASREPGAFFDLLTEAVAAQRDALRAVRAARVEIDGVPMGFPDALARLLADPLDARIHEHHRTLMLGYWGRRLAGFLADEYHLHAHFYDTVAHTQASTALELRTEEDPVRQWLVIVDLHS